MDLPVKFSQEKYCLNPEVLFFLLAKYYVVAASPGLLNNHNISVHFYQIPNRSGSIF